MSNQYDVAIIGAGIVGLAHAWSAAERGLSVVVFERSREAEGASVRNFGMIWPVGQPAGEPYEIALSSRDRWLQLDEAKAIELEQCGSIHLAHRQDELAVLEEFCDKKTHQCNMMTADEIRNTSSIVNPEQLLGGMWSPTELRADPRTASKKVAGWLAETHNVKFHFQTPIREVENKTIRSSDGRTWQAERIVVCSGSDLQTLFPKAFEASGLKLCKLQMLKTRQSPQAGSNRSHLASGLTLRHYQSFEPCPTLVNLRNRVAEETPELDQYGIHVMASWFPNGDVVLGDSHEYDSEISPFNKEVIDTLIVRELKKVLHLQDWTIHERWHGVYAKYPDAPAFETMADEGVHVFTGTGGAGMTMSFGLAEQAWKKWESQ